MFCKNARFTWLRTLTKRGGKTILISVLKKEKMIFIAGERSLNMSLVGYKAGFDLYS
jgi:hypothetical protein